MLVAAGVDVKASGTGNDFNFTMLGLSGIILNVMAAHLNSF